MSTETLLRRRQSLRQRTTTSPTPGGGPVTELSLAIAVSQLNSRLRRDGVSAHELWT